PAELGEAPEPRTQHGVGPPPPGRARGPVEGGPDAVDLEAVAGKELCEGPLVVRRDVIPPFPKPAAEEAQVVREPECVGTRDDQVARRAEQRRRCLERTPGIVEM